MTTTSPMGPAADPVALGRRVVEILEVGRRVATYKLATLSALIEFCVENFPVDDPTVSLDVPLDALADRVIALYWRQVLPFKGAGLHGPDRTLRQNTGKKARILLEVEKFRQAAKATDREMPLDIAKSRAPRHYARAQRNVRNVLVWRPLYRLQRLPVKGGGQTVSDPFLYDDDWMGEDIPVHVIDEHGVVELRPGVASALARLSGLLTPVLEMLWVKEIRRMNPALSEGVPDIEGHLFGRDRISLSRAFDALTEAFDDLCFYCRKRSASEVDHVLPWSRSRIDGLANLVQACHKCNDNKRVSLPSPEHVQNALDRGRSTLQQIADSITWPLNYDDVRSVGRGLYLSAPETPVWIAVNETGPLDLSPPPEWMLTFGGK